MADVRLQDGNWPAYLAARPADSLFFTAAPRAIQAGAQLGNRADYLSIDVPCAGTMSARTRSHVCRAGRRGRGS